MYKYNKNDFFIVTGGSSGIGKEIALQLNKYGASVIIIGRNTGKLEETKSLSENPQNMYIETKDLSVNVNEIDKYIGELKEKYGKFRGLVCSAGINSVLPLQIIKETDINKLFDINYKAPLFCTKGFIDKRNNIGEGSSIVFITSISADFPDKGQAIYGASKAALICSAKAISKEIIKRKIRINCISPSWVNTEMYKNQKDLIGIDENLYSLGINEPDDIANLALFLLSDKAKKITGQNYIIDAGAY